MSMHRIVVEPPKQGVHLIEADEPIPGPDEVLVETLEVGIDGTDHEIARGEYGATPKGEKYLTLGHEALGRVLETQNSGSLRMGDLVVPTVRRGCDLCLPCKSGQSDFCFTGLYKERGISGIDGFNSERWTDTEEYLVPVDADLREVAVITEPLSVVVKALDQTLKIQERLPWKETEDLGEKKALVAGSGSLGLMATFLLRLERAEVLTMDRQADDVEKSRLIERLGAEHLNAREVDPLMLARDFDGFDIIVEATGAPQVPFDLLPALGDNGIMVLLGVPGKKVSVEVDATSIVRDMVLANQVVFGTVNSNASHFRRAMGYLRKILERYPQEVRSFISHRHAWRDFEVAFGDRGKDVIKDVLVWQDNGRGLE
jgi:threonine dehydrogenase-like Zn-dependent dehydrogenase